MCEPGTVLVLVTARGGSKGLPGKNLRHVGGISLVGRALLAGRRFQVAADLDRNALVLDTDDEAIAAEGRTWGARVPFLRPPELARDTTSSVDTVLHLVDRLRARGEPTTTVILLQPTAPLRTAADVAAAWELYRRSGAPLVVSLVRCEHPPEFSVRLHEDGRASWAFGPVTAHRRQDLPPAFRPNGAVYIVNVDYLAERRRFFDPDVMACYEMPVERSVDIDAAVDLRTAEAMLDEQPLAALPGREAGGPAAVIARWQERRPCPRDVATALARRGVAFVRDATGRLTPLDEAGWASSSAGPAAVTVVDASREPAAEAWRACVPVLERGERPAVIIGAEGDWTAAAARARALGASLEVAAGVRVPAGVDAAAIAAAARLSFVESDAEQLMALQPAPPA